MRFQLVELKGFYIKFGGYTFILPRSLDNIPDGILDVLIASTVVRLYVIHSFLRNCYTYCHEIL